MTAGSFKTGASALVGGTIFGLGLAISGMTLPAKVVGFLDISGDWDPSLAFVMGGAVAVYAVGLRLVTRRTHPILGPRFLLPTRTDISPRLLGGAALFGLGWGIGGFCPGPALTSLVGGGTEALVFVGAMALGMALFGRVDRSIPRPAPAAPRSGPSAGPPSSAQRHP